MQTSQSFNGNHCDALRCSDMPEHLINETANKLPPRFGGTSPSDVFLMVKGYVSDRELCQPPLVVWPGRFAAETMDALRKIASNQVPRALDNFDFIVFFQSIVSIKKLMDAKELPHTWMMIGRTTYSSL